MNVPKTTLIRALADRLGGRGRGYMAAGVLLVLAGGAMAYARSGRGGGSAPAAAAASAKAGDAHGASPAAEKRAGEAGAAASPEVKLSARERAAALHVARPARIRGLYLNAWAAGSKRKLAKLLAIADRTEINTFVIDVKEGGYISYRSGVPLAGEIGSDKRYIPDIRGVLAQLKAHDIYPIARIVCFKDPVLATAKPEWAIQKADGSFWRDSDDHLWVDSYNRKVWDYNIAIAREAAELGFGEIQWDYVRFPDVTASRRATQVFPAEKGRTREQAIREFVAYSKEKLADLGVPVTTDVFGLTVSAHDDMGIGQKWESMVGVSDVMLPMVYPSHFAHGSYGIHDPNAHPYDIIRDAMKHALERTPPELRRHKIRPWLQDFTLGPPHYGTDEVRAQISAVYDSGLREWILWNPGSNYTVEALRPKGEAMQPPDAPDSLLSQPGDRPAVPDSAARR